MDTIPMTVNGAKALEVELLSLRKKSAQELLVILQLQESMAILKRMLNIMLLKRARLYRRSNSRD